MINGLIHVLPYSSYFTHLRSRTSVLRAPAGIRLCVRSHRLLSWRARAPTVTPATPVGTARTVFVRALQRQRVHHRCERATAEASLQCEDVVMHCAALAVQLIANVVDAAQRANVRRDRIVSTRVHNRDALRLCILVVCIDGGLHEMRLASDVDVVARVLNARRDDRDAILGVRTDSGHQNRRLRRHGVERSGIRCVDSKNGYASQLCSLRSHLFAHRFECFHVTAS
jgi:hypothetical protein